jgi:hypothetical protein
VRLGRRRAHRVRFRRPCTRPGCSSGDGRGSCGSFVAHCGAGVSVPGGDLDVSQVHASVEHGRDEGVPKHMGVRPGNPDTRGVGQLPKAPGGGMAIHSAAAGVQQDGPFGRSLMALSIARPTAGGRGIRTTLPPLPDTRRTRWPCSSPKSVMLAAVASKIRRPSSPSMLRARSHTGWAIHGPR